MYISALWVVSPDGSKRGVNVEVYRHPTGLPHDGDLKKLVKDPGGASPSARYTEVTPGGNRVEAALDLVLADEAYSRDAVIRALDAMATEHLKRLVRPVPWTIKLPEGEMRGLFTSYLGPMDPTSARVVFSLLRDAITAALAKLDKKRAA